MAKVKKEKIAYKLKEFLIQIIKKKKKQSLLKKIVTVAMSQKLNIWKHVINFNLVKKIVKN
jgi:hypothetical protein